MVKRKACVFISGKGSNLENLIKKSRDYNVPINISLVISNNKKAEGIKFAKMNFIPFFIFNEKSRFFDYQVLNILKYYNVNLICLAGYMCIISKNFLRRYKKKIINIHPSLLPKFKGLNTYTRVLKEKEKKTGCTVHYVNEKIDDGKIIIQKSFIINSNDREKDLKLKTQKLEKNAFPEAVIKIYKTN